MKQTNKKNLKTTRSNPSPLRAKKTLRNLYEPSAACWRDIEGKPRPFKKVHLMDSEPVTPEPETACSHRAELCSVWACSKTNASQGFNAGWLMSMQMLYS